LRTSLSYWRISPINREIQGRLVYAIPKGRTSLLDAIYLGYQQDAPGQTQQKALLIIF